MIKLIVTDMDGTLLNDNKELPANFSEIYHKLTSADIHFAVASGRPVYSLKPIFSHIKNNISYIGDNGAYIKTEDESRILDSIDSAKVHQIIDIIELYKELEIIICTEHSAFIARDHWYFFATAYNYYKNLAMIDDLKLISIPVLKIAIYHKEQWHSIDHYNFENLESELNFSLSGHNWLDIMPQGINKGEGIKILQTKYDASPEETMVFGDYLNDLEMIQQAKFSYAMENAHPEIIKAASFKAPSNNNNGVMSVIASKLGI